jgi:outer membrane receptor for ferrienterochelin and colicins
MLYKFPNAFHSIKTYSYIFFFLFNLTAINPVFCSENTEELLELPLAKLVNVEVVSASRFKQKISEAPSSAEVLTAQDIRSFGWRTLSDALNAIRGLYAKNDRGYSLLGNRGFLQQGDFSSRMLFMIDGRRMNENIYDTGFIGEEFMLDMNLIDRIEYIPGAGSSVYGANALLGVVNVITKQGKSFDGLHLSGEAGSLDTYRGRATFGKQWANGADVLVNASQYFSHGNEELFFPEFNTQDNNNGIAQDMDIERSKRLFGQFNYKNLSIKAGHVDRYKRDPTAGFKAVFNMKDYFSIDRQTYVDLNYNTQVAAGLEMQARGFYHWYDYYSLGAYPNSKKRPVFSYDAAHSHWSGGELKFKGTQFANHQWILGLEFQYDHRQHLIQYDTQPYDLTFDVNYSGWRSGVYVQDEYKLLENLKISAGLRLDQHHMLTSLQLNPRLGIIWDITPTLTAKFLYSSAFRAPNALEYDDDTEPFNGRHNPQNREERIKTYEAVAEWYPEPDIRILGTLFHNHFNRVLQADPDNRYFNTGEYNTYGFELQGEKHWDNGRLLKFSWTRNYTRDEVRDNGSWAVESPKNMVKLHFAEPFFDNRMRVGLEEIFVDERRTLNKDTIISGYHLMNINLASGKPIYGFQASLGIYNVLDQRYKVVGDNNLTQDALAVDGRTVRFRLDYGF